MALLGTQIKNDQAAAYGSKCAFAGVCSTAPTATAAGTEPTGGSPAYARKALAWSSGGTGVVTSSCTHDIPAGFVAGWFAFWSALAGTYEDGGAYGASQTFASQGTLASTFTNTET